MTMFRHVVMELASSATGSRRLHSSRPPSTTRYSNRGPKNSKAVRARHLADSPSPAGQRPMRWRAPATDRPPHCIRMYSVAAEHSVHDSVTEAMRARITEGLSRDRVGDGRVLEER